MKVDGGDAIVGVRDIDDFDWSVLEDIRAAGLEGQAGFVESHAQDVENVADCGFLVASEAVLGKGARAAESEVPGFVFAKENAVVFLFAEVLALTLGKPVGSISDIAVVACIEFRDAQAVQFLPIEGVGAAGLLAVFHVQITVAA